MAEFISKAAIMAHIEEQSRRWGEEYDAEQILGDIEDFPVADVVEQKIGKWLPVENSTIDYGICSVCGYQAALYGNKYCPRCGSYNGGTDDV